jgi:hypothetical protein
MLNMTQEKIKIRGGLLDTSGDQNMDSSGDISKIGPMKNYLDESF